MNEVNEQQVRRLDEMDEREARRFLEELYSVLSAEKEYALRHEDYVMEMPQSGERIRGRQNMRAFQEAFASYSNPPSIRRRRVLVRDGLWVVEGVNDYGEGRVFNGVLIVELRDGKIWRDTRYYGEPFEAPEWRSRWVERMGPGEPDATLVRDRRNNEMEGHEIEKLIERNWEKVRAGDFAGAHEWYDDAVVVEWPQSGERIRGKKNLLALREAYPARVEFEIRRVIGRRDLGVSEYVIRYDGDPVNVVSIMEFEGAKIVRETHYFADPFPPPEWRAQWVERTETG